MYRGRLVEQGATADVLHAPQHVYTEVLMSAVPAASAADGRPARMRARIDSGPATGGAGCVFLDRCPRSQVQCAEPPRVVDLGGGHSATCVLAGQLGKEVGEVANATTSA
jgi:oligopeptide/dipeptide ABC transporter ATP-binding protein